MTTRKPTAGSPSSDDPEFTATARAYGGQKGYAQALASGRTTLDYPQWVQTRTPSFKDWFGDWEALRTEQQLDAMPPVQVRVPEEWRGLDHVALREKMALALNEMISSKEPIKHPEVGGIRVSRVGGRKSESSARDPAKSLIVADLRNVLAQTVVARTTPPETKEQGVDGYGTLLARVSVDGVPLVASFSIKLQRDGAWYYNAVALQDPAVEKEKGRDSYGSPGALERPLGETPIAGLDQFIRRPLRRVNSQSISKAINPETGEPLVLYRRAEEALSQPGQPHGSQFFITQSPSSSGTAPVFLSAKSLGGDHFRNGDAWQVFDPAQIQPADGQRPSLTPSAGDRSMPDPIHQESAVYGDIPPAPQADPDSLFAGNGQPDAFDALANELLIDDVAMPTFKEQETTPPAPAPKRGGRAKAKETPSKDSAQAPAAPAKRAKKAKADPSPTPATEGNKPKRPSASKSKKPAKAPEVAAPAPTPTPAPPGVAALDPHAQQRLDRVSANRADDLEKARNQLDAEAAARARIHMLQDPAGRHIVALQKGGVTKAYAVDKDPSVAARTVNKLRDSISKLVGETQFLPDVIKTRFRTKSGEEKVVYNVDPEGVDPQHSQMREAGLGENDRRNLVVIPEGKPDEVSKRVLLSSDLPDDVKKRFVHSDSVPGQYFDRNRKLAFIDKGGRLATDQNAPEIINSMISVAQAKNWKAITVKGHEEFRREAWLAATLSGIEVKGFTPSEPDLARLDHERQQRMGNAIQPAAPTQTPVSNEIEGVKREAPQPIITADAISLGEVARLKGVREDQIPEFMNAAQTFFDVAHKIGMETPALKIYDLKAPAAPAVTLPEKGKTLDQSISIPEPEKAPKR